MAKSITMVDCKTGNSFQTLVPHKGKWKYGTQACIGFIDRLGYNKAVVQCDGETPIADFGRAVARERGSATLR
eukprot:14964050-Alexandrium_andersonii.AAC.1